MSLSNMLELVVELEPVVKLKLVFAAHELVFVQLEPVVKLKLVVAAHGLVFVQLIGGKL